MLGIIKDIILLVLGAFAGVAADRFIKRKEYIIQNKSLKKRIEKIQYISDEELNITNLANAVPYYNHNNIKVVPTNKSLYLSFPEDLKTLLTDQDLSFHSDTSFNGRNDFKDITQSTGILNLGDLIERHRRIVANDIINSKNGFYFNGEKFGIFKLSTFNSVGKDEESSFTISLFHTDYFTHRVFKSIYKELKQDNHPISEGKLEDVNRYNCFNTSFGVNALVIVDSPEGEKILLCERAIHSSNTIKKGLYHVTVNEGLSQTDSDTYYQSINLKQCLERGLYEELGLTQEDLVEYQAEICFYDLFLERNRFELGITSSCKLHTSFEEGISHLVAKDKVLEIASIKPILINKNDLNQFINENDFIPHGLYGLRMFAARRRLLLHKKTS